MKTKGLLALGLGIAVSIFFGMDRDKDRSKRHEPAGFNDEFEKVRRSTPKVMAPVVYQEPVEEQPRRLDKTKKPIQNSKPKEQTCYVKLRMMGSNRDQVQRGKQYKIKKYGKCA